MSGTSFRLTFLKVAVVAACVCATADPANASVTLLELSSVGSSPVAVASTVSGGVFLTANSGSSDVSFVDGKTNGLVANVQIGTFGVSVPSAIAITPNGKRALVTDRGLDTVVILDVKKRKVVKTLDVGSEPTDVDVSPNGQLAYVSNSESFSLTVIDLKTERVSKTLPVATGVIQLELFGNAKYGYLRSTVGQLWKIRMSTGAVGASSLGSGDYDSFDSSPNGATLFGASTNGLDVIDTAAGTTTTRLLTGEEQPRVVAVSADGSQVWAARRFANAVDIVSTESNTVLEVKSIPNPGIAVAFATNGTRAYTLSTGTNAVTVWAIE